MIQFSPNQCKHLPATVEARRERCAGAAAAAPAESGLLVLGSGMLRAAINKLHPHAEGPEAVVENAEDLLRAVRPAAELLDSRCDVSAQEYGI
jgi:hypothetical protein